MQKIEKKKVKKVAAGVQITESDASAKKFIEKKATKTSEKQK